MAERVRFVRALRVQHFLIRARRPQNNSWMTSPDSTIGTGRPVRLRKLMLGSMPSTWWMVAWKSPASSSTTVGVTGAGRESVRLDYTGRKTNVTCFFSPVDSSRKSALTGVPTLTGCSGLTMRAGTVGPSFSATKPLM